MFCADKTGEFSATPPAQRTTNTSAQSPSTFGLPSVHHGITPVVVRNISSTGCHVAVVCQPRDRKTNKCVEQTGELVHV